MDNGITRRFPVGAEPLLGGGVHFRVWAPTRAEVQVVFEARGHEARLRPCALKREPGGYFSGLAAQVRPGDRYRFLLDGTDGPYPDPASRFQPLGPHGPSEVVDPTSFTWTDNGWTGPTVEGMVLYEMHVGSFTPEGTWEAAERQLPELAALGVTAIEMLPLADFPGRFGWGYDGVNLFAPTRLYGRPDDLRRFVARAHGLGISVLHDVVYNHFGGDGNYIGAFSEAYFTDRYECEWGKAINFDGPDAAPVREFFLSNAAYWVEEFHFDGLRLDATQALNDASADHIICALRRRVRDAARGRSTVIVAENEPQNARIIRPFDQGGMGVEMAWNDDFHHTALVALTGRREAYYMDYAGTPQEFISLLKHGYLFQGQHYVWQGKARGGTTRGLRPPAFVTYLQNHDQIANSGCGLRLHRLSSPGRLRAVTAVLLLGPNTPLIFQGQEFAASAPFAYFNDLDEGLAEEVREGRRKFLSQFPSLATPEMQAELLDPRAEATFLSSKLDFSDRQRHKEVYSLHRDLLRLRREDPVFRAQGAWGLDGAVIGPQAFVMRFFSPDECDRLLLVNFGADLRIAPMPEPLLAPPPRGRWQRVWSSEDPRYGGCGTPEPCETAAWRLPAESAIAMAAAFSERIHA